MVLESVDDDSRVVLVAKGVLGNDVTLRFVSVVDDMELRVVRLKF